MCNVNVNDSANVTAAIRMWIAVGSGPAGRAPAVRALAAHPAAWCGPVAAVLAAWNGAGASSCPYGCESGDWGHTASAATALTVARILKAGDAAREAGAGAEWEAAEKYWTDAAAAWPTAAKAAGV